jgi:16S rRNA (cytosine1402-N4)-methyltransferase
VLLAEVLAALRPRSGGRYVDCTLGAGGHAEAVLEASSPDGRLLGLDADPDALELARERLRRYGERAVFVHENYRELATVLTTTGFSGPDGVDGVLYDFGVSSMQLDRPERGFSFAADGPLDMRFDRRAGPTAADLVNDLPERRLADILFAYGEERWARRIARAIAARRAAAPFHTTADLARVIAAAVPGGRGGQRIHPATRAFQALRIAVSDELAGLEATLPAAVDALRPGGRLAVIAFHSLEDRIVKRFLRDQEGRCACPPGLPVCRCGARAHLRILTKKPIVPASAEVAANPRSRSARLRVAEKLGPPGVS